MALTVGQTVDLATVALEDLTAGVRFKTPTNMEVEVQSVTPGVDGSGRSIRTFAVIIVSSPDPRQNGQPANFPILTTSPSLAPITALPAAPAAAPQPTPTEGFGGFGAPPEFPPPVQPQEMAPPPVVPPVQPVAPPAAPQDQPQAGTDSTQGTWTTETATPEIRAAIAATIVEAFTGGASPTLDGVEPGANLTAMGVRSKLKAKGINPEGGLLADVATKDLGLKAENFRFYYGTPAVQPPTAPPPAAPQAQPPTAPPPVQPFAAPDGVQGTVGQCPGGPTGAPTEPPATEEGLERDLDRALAQDNLRDLKAYGAPLRLSTPGAPGPLGEAEIARGVLYAYLGYTPLGELVQALTTLVGGAILTPEEVHDLLVGNR